MIKILKKVTKNQSTNELLTNYTMLIEFIHAFWCDVEKLPHAPAYTSKRIFILKP